MYQIRTNGVEHDAAAHYVRRLVKSVLGVELSEETGNLRRYIVTHEDRARGLYFHPVLLEKFAKARDYGLRAYVDELRLMCGKVRPVRCHTRYTRPYLRVARATEIERDRTRSTEIDTRGEGVTHVTRRALCALIGALIAGDRDRLVEGGVRREPQQEGS